jgi:hypothetical protein
VSELLLTVVAADWLLPALVALEPALEVDPEVAVDEPLFTGAVTAVDVEPDVAPELDVDVT